MFPRNGGPDRLAPQNGAPAPVRHEAWLPRDHPLYRPRHSRRQRTALTCALVFFLVPAVAFVLGVRPVQFENHRLAAFPSISAGWGFFTGLSAWATDNLPLRNLGVKADAAISQRVFGELPSYAQNDRQTTDGPLGQQPGGNSGTSPVIQGTNGWLYYAADIEGKCHPQQPLATTIDALRQLRSAVEASGRKFVLVVAPDKSTAVPQYLPADYPDKECAAPVLTQFWNEVTSVDGDVDLRGPLQTLSAAEHQPLYYPLDTHWTDLGAITMVRSIAEQITPGVTATWKYDPATPEAGPADLSLMIGQSGTNHGEKYHLRPDGGADRAGTEIPDLSQAAHLSGPPTTGMITQPVTILGDSFLVASTAYLPAAFSDVTAIAYGSVAGEPSLVEQAMTSAKVVVLEVVERNLTAGTAPFLEPAVIDSIRDTLAAHPMR